MNVRLTIFKSGNIRAERELTQCGGRPTGIWMPIGEYKTIRGVKVAITKFAIKHETVAQYQPTIYSQF